MNLSPRGKDIFSAVITGRRSIVFVAAVACAVLVILCVDRLSAQPDQPETSREREGGSQDALAGNDKAVADAVQRATALEEETAQLRMEIEERDTRIAELEAEVVAAKQPAEQEVDVEALQQELSELKTLYAALLDERETARGRDGRTRRTEKPAQSKTPAPADKPLAVPVPGKEGFYTSPFAPEEGFIDLRGFKSGTEVKDPYTGRIIFVP